ncbi:hypothetical protein M5689_013852 [Euphorbia peplus]|nr:hypothetical protein M5689_013852 [Euphorbia peplus]
MSGIESEECAMGLDRNGSVNGRKRKTNWSEAEDLQLLCAVEKYGEGNWSTILSNECTWLTSPSQLSQRWAVIRTRKDANFNLPTTTTPTISGGMQLSEAQRATRIALNSALGLPIKNSFIKSAEGTSSPHFPQTRIATKPSSLTVNKPVKADLSSDPVRAAAGARIATQSDAASLLRVAEAGSSIKSALPGCASEAYSNCSFNRLPTASTTQQNPVSGTAKNVSPTAQANTEVPLKQGLCAAMEKASSLNLARGLPLKNSFIKSVDTAEGTSSPHFSQSCIATKPSSITVNKPVKGDLSSHPVRAAAIAAGGRIATQSHAASLLRVAQAKNAIHKMPTIGSSNKLALPQAYSNGSFNSLPTTSVSIKSTTQQNPTSGTAVNVSTRALANTEVPLKQGLHPALEKASSQSTAAQHNSIPLKQDVNTGGMNISVADHVAKVEVEEHRVSIAAGKEPSKQVKLEKAVLLNQETQESVCESERLKAEAEEIIRQEQMFFKLVFKDIFENECPSEW